MSVPALQSPIVLVHGLLGFDTIRIGRLILANYWPKIPQQLRNAGNRVFVARVNPIGCIADRAAQLRDFINLHSPKEPVHIFGHSMGGLDSRYMISRLGMADRVHSLTTIATPHRGSSFATWALRRWLPVMRPFLELFNIGCQAIVDLTPESCARFNDEVVDAPGVRYYSIAGEYQTTWLTPTWKISARVLDQEEGPNDGVVSVASAKWGEDCGTWQGDHISLVNMTSLWSRLTCQAVDRVPEYGRHLEKLAAEGF